MVGIASGQPLDTLRVRLQQQNCQQRSVAAVWRAMAAKEGFRGLFRGMSYPIYTTALQVSCRQVLRVLVVSCTLTEPDVSPAP